MMNMFLHMYTFCMHKLQNKKQKQKNNSQPTFLFVQVNLGIIWYDLNKSMLLSTLFFPDFITVSITTGT